MRGQANVPQDRSGPKHIEWLAAALLVLTSSLLLGCAHKEPPAVTPSGPGHSPVVSLSPDTSTTAVTKPSPDRKLFKTGEAVPAGYLGYKVSGCWFTDHLRPADLAAKSHTSYLAVDLSVVNTDKKERPIGPFKLIDEKGREFVLSEKASTVENSVGLIGKLGPNVSKRALAIFEAPVGHQYKLRLPGFTEADAVQIELSPAAATSTK